MSVHEVHKWTRGRLSRETESGQTMSEYAFVLAILVPGALLLFTGLGDAVASGLTNVARLLP